MTRRLPRPRRSPLLIVPLLAGSLAGGGCTRWSTQAAYQPHREVGRRVVGSPMIEEVTSSNLAAGFAGVSATDGYGNRQAVGGLAGSHGSVKRTHCVQQAEVDFVQPYDLVPVVDGRTQDVGGAIALGGLGLLVAGVARGKYAVDRDAYESELDFYRRDPDFFSRPSEPSPPTAAYVVGGVALIGAAGWLIYSLSELPRGRPPAAVRQERRWTEVRYVEATGCGLVPADRSGAAEPRRRSRAAEAAVAVHGAAPVRHRGAVEVAARAEAAVVAAAAAAVRVQPTLGRRPAGASHGRLDLAADDRAAALHRAGAVRGVGAGGDAVGADAAVVAAGLHAVAAHPALRPGGAAACADLARARGGRDADRSARGRHDIRHAARQGRAQEDEEER
jgi:hypothetical protein